MSELHRTRRTDVVIIGAGILGAAAAFHLAEAGHRVAVLERGAPNREGSGTTAGNLHIQGIHTRRPGQDVPVDSERFLPLQRAASERWSTVEKRLDADVELRRGGGFMVAETAEQENELHEKREWERAAGIATELLTGDQAREWLPLLSDRVRAATWCALDGYANPLLITPAYLAAAFRHGAQVHAFTPVTGIDRVVGGYVVHSGDRSWSAPVVVNAAGPWIGEVAALAGIALEMAPVVIQMHATVRVPPVMRHLVQHIGEGMSVKQVTAGNLLIGGGWPARPVTTAGRGTASMASLTGNLAQACRVLPFLAGLRLLRVWAGPLAATPDEMPVIGEVPGHPGFLVAGGTYAFTFAPLWGETLRALVAGDRPPEPIDDLGPGRLTRRTETPLRKGSCPR
ncbi:NAD(P)/FAD-dependent oxidoreductase [Streptomyces sp. NBC_01803]|uniref:NAD(P)/FAD-dependent oxidoreductase n=1 Tax=Streptomyces sp. NBC_01803 TaxID=2975946 RepID=UPI002DD87C98|nr:FAD-dependent oxidoreductase [Streptomyces sp. NBC_01803]WSA43295.1 FAD-binding oxidoreductase [Streptomyces sp. NBC_01803]